MKKIINRIVIIIEYTPDLFDYNSVKKNKSNHEILVELLCTFLEKKILYDSTCEIALILAGYKSKEKKSDNESNIYILEKLKRVNFGLYKNLLNDILLHKKFNEKISYNDVFLKALELLNKTNNSKKVKYKDKLNNFIIFLTCQKKKIIHFNFYEYIMKILKYYVSLVIIGLNFKRNFFFDNLFDLNEYIKDNENKIKKKSIKNQIMWNKVILLCNGSIYTYIEAFKKIKNDHLTNEKSEKKSLVNFIIPNAIEITVEIHSYTSTQNIHKNNVNENLFNKYYENISKSLVDFKEKKNNHSSCSSTSKCEIDHLKMFSIHNNFLYFNEENNFNTLKKYLSSNFEVKNLYRKNIQEEVINQGYNKLKKNKEINNNVIKYYKYGSNYYLPTDEIDTNLIDDSNKCELKCLCTIKKDKIDWGNIVGTTYFVVTHKKDKIDFKMMNYLIYSLHETNYILICSYKTKDSKYYTVGLKPICGNLTILNLFFLAYKEHINYFNFNMNSSNQENSNVFDELIDLLDLSEEFLPKKREKIDNNRGDKIKSIENYNTKNSQYYKNYIMKKNNQINKSRILKKQKEKIDIRINMGEEKEVYNVINENKEKHNKKKKEKIDCKYICDGDDYENYSDTDEDDCDYNNNFVSKIKKRSDFHNLYSVKSTKERLLTRNIHDVYLKSFYEILEGKCRLHFTSGYENSKNKIINERYFPFLYKNEIYQFIDNKKIMKIHDIVNKLKMKFAIKLENTYMLKDISESNKITKLKTSNFNNNDNLLKNYNLNVHYKITKNSNSLLLDNVSNNSSSNSYKEDICFLYNENFKKDTNYSYSTKKYFLKKELEFSSDNDDENSEYTFNLYDVDKIKIMRLHNLEIYDKEELLDAFNRKNNFRKIYCTNETMSPTKKKKLKT
ncbi:hypothetical protein PGAL8A_00407100 [Plasmodium gallinaceum]|uniref:Uncharacterized protein n=1 Tax=Plasmodium gallinaceum TaxID=5849 RepID=A0A1J1GPE3_PLAGA|nr:hypothetical protein PGAL8A_00407100 [Plasmodium gallinaceum]CRG94367.1 hypothetical protein PGAL8A_00407100 [Plasmodium gallinaceum]